MLNILNRSSINWGDPRNHETRMRNSQQLCLRGIGLHSINLTPSTSWVCPAILSCNQSCDGGIVGVFDSVGCSDGRLQRLKKTFQRIGPSTVPCGTYVGQVFALELTPWYVTTWHLSETKLQGGQNHLAFLCVLWPLNVFFSPILFYIAYPTENHASMNGRK